MKKIAFVFTLLSSIGLNVFAQYSINPTRPSASDNAFITSYGYSELEIGALVQKDFYSVPALLKVSPFERVEVGVSFSGLVNHSTFGDDSKTDFGDFGLQLKSILYKSDCFGTAVLGKIEFPSPVDPKYTFYSTSSLLLNFGQADITLGTVMVDNVTEYDNSFIYALAFSPKLEGPIGVFVEIFGESVNGVSPISADAGLVFSVSPNLVIDTAAAFGLNDDAADFVFQLGLTTKLFKVF
jgi:hypothetical protein